MKQDFLCRHPALSAQLPFPKPLFTYHKEEFYSLGLLSLLLLPEDEAVSLAHVRKTMAMPEEMQRNWTDPLWIFFFIFLAVFLYSMKSRNPHKSTPWAMHAPSIIQICEGAFVYCAFHEWTKYMEFLQQPEAAPWNHCAGSIYLILFEPLFIYRTFFFLEIFSLFRHFGFGWRLEVTMPPLV